MTSGRALAWVAALAIGCGSTSPSGPGAEPTAGPPPLDRAKVDHVSLLLRGRVTTDREWADWRRRSAADIVGELAGDRFVAETLAPALIFRNNLLRPPRNTHIRMYELASAEIGGATVLFLGRPCKPADVTTVRPWWDPAQPVAVCKQAVRADVWETPTPRGVQDCNQRTSSPRVLPTSRCGCGPNLVRCGLPGYDDGVQVSAQREVSDTVAHVVATDQPLARLFTMNETHRDRTTEQFYLRNMIHSRRIADPEAMVVAASRWPVEGKVAPREQAEPGQHAGVLTMPQFVYHVFDPRQRMRIIFEAMWCAGESAPGALPEDLLSLHTPNLSIKNAGWQELAARPVCTHCHARLDYGMQFFAGYAAPAESSFHFLRRPPATGPLYADSIDDPRGSAALTPLGFAELATSQPEFARCMAANVVEYMFGGSAPAGSVDRLARSAAPTELKLRQLLRLAALEFLSCDSCSPPTRWRSAAPVGATRPVLATLAGEHCTDCHHDGASIPSFEGKLDRQLRLRMVDQVLFGRMPPSGPLPWSVRQQFAATLGSPERAADEEAIALLSGRAEPPAAMPLLVAREQLRHLAGQHASPSDINSLETALAGRNNLFTPNYVLLTGSEALDTCAKLDRPRGACLDRALDLIWGPAK